MTSAEDAALDARRHGTCDFAPPPHNAPVQRRPPRITSFVMDESPPAQAELALKIRRLAEERGYNQDPLARIARINRHTVRQIFAGGGERGLRNLTVSKCADALGLTVNELRTQ